MIEELLKGLEYSGDTKDFFVRCHSPRRNFLDLRSEFNTDALNLAKKYSDIYVLMSSGVDSQIITRVFLDNKINCEYIFLNSVGYCDYELEHVKECEKFYGIKVRKIDLNIENFRQSWIERSKIDEPFSMYNYPFEYLSESFKDNYPFVTQGAIEPALTGKNIVSIYCNYYENMQVRHRIMSKYRPVVDFPYSPEAIASYYTDETMKIFVDIIRYYKENNISLNTNLSSLQYYNSYCKPILKGKYFRKDILWFGKRHGYENFPKWFTTNNLHIKETRVSIPYWDIVDFMENNIDKHKDYRDWNYGDIAGFRSIDEKE